MSPKSGRTGRPGSDGEHLLQEQYGTSDRAERFYRDQMRDRLTPRMVDFLARQSRMIIASADAEGRPDASVRFGEPGFVVVLGKRTVAWPELRGNGVMTTLGNLIKNPYVHLMFLDNAERIGLHLRGEASVVERDMFVDEHPRYADLEIGGRAPERWVIVSLATSYVHCRKHFPRTDAPVEWQTDDVKAKGGDYFETKDTPAPWTFDDAD